MRVTVRGRVGVRTWIRVGVRVISVLISVWLTLSRRY